VPLALRGKLIVGAPHDLYNQGLTKANAGLGRVAEADPRFADDVVKDDRFDVKLVD